MRLSKKNSIILSTAIVVVFFVGAIVIIPTTKPLPESTVTAAPKNNDNAILVLNNFTRNEIKNGKKKWEIIASRGEFYKENNELKLFDPDLKIYKDNGASYHLTAKSALAKLVGAKIGEVTATGDVVIINNDGVKVSSNSLSYNAQAHTITSKELVTIESERGNASGIGLLANTETEEIKLYKAVKTDVYPAPPKTAKVKNVPAPKPSRAPSKLKKVKGKR